MEKQLHNELAHYLLGVIDGQILLTMPARERRPIQDLLAGDELLRILERARDENPSVAEEESITPEERNRIIDLSSKVQRVVAAEAGSSESLSRKRLGLPIT